MSFFHPRRRHHGAVATKSRRNIDGSSSKGCFAIANESCHGSGIYFSRDEATRQIIAMRSPRSEIGNGDVHVDPKIRRFDKVRDAEAFLQNCGFAPVIQTEGWISARNKRPILYASNRNSAVRHESGSTSSRKNSNEDAQPPNPGAVVDDDERAQASDHPQPFRRNDSNRSKRPSSPPSSPPLSSSSSSSSSSSLPLRSEKRRRSDRTGMSRENEGRAEPGKAPDDASMNEEARRRGFFQQQTKFDTVQQQAIDAAMAGKNIFLTGVAGTGKSLVTKKIVEDAKNLGREVAVAAPTGVAAVNLGPELGAQTIHSLAGVGVPQTASDFEKMMTRYTAKKWKKIEMLVLDEVGMLAADFLDWMDVYIRKARRNPLLAFGGIQLVFVGDFAQLGPIPGRAHSIRNKAFAPDQPGADCFLGVSECAAYAFQTVLWREANFHHVHLRKVYRQKNKDFQLALMDIREAKAESERVKDLVKICSSPLEDREGLRIPEGIKPTILYCTNRDVDRENFENLSRLLDKGKAFLAKDSTVVSEAVDTAGFRAVERILTKNSFFQDCSASKKLHLKVGAQVMLLQNLDVQKGLVNGSRGVVEAFKLVPVVKDILKGEERLIGPDDVAKFPGCRFEDLKFHQKTEFEGKIWRVCRFDRYPLVRFVNNISRIIVKESFERTLYRQGRCLREQVPLRLAWALTIHKSQGATLDYVVCDLKGCFTSGQSYVALSRARSMLGLQIRNFCSDHVTADPLVEAFYDALDRHDTTAFLEEKAGLWWFPILKSPAWLRMFQHASSKNAKLNSQQFRSWVADYTPLHEYQGWGA